MYNAVTVACNGEMQHLQLPVTDAEINRIQGHCIIRCSLATKRIVQVSLPAAIMQEREQLNYLPVGIAESAEFEMIASDACPMRCSMQTRALQFEVTLQCLDKKFFIQERLFFHMPDRNSFL
jgi:hypothetical protein